MEAGLSLRIIADKLNSHISTVYREIKRGQVKRLDTHLKEYCICRANAGIL
ncbi:MAG: hypothetical protein COX96_04125 [Candidatus Omnitrophica bacterium CG_4_10_14_0_2_um_filter_44_9]|nr:MAG: hypothetical protein COY78_04350 [Candidatus Omnitrophica bacterium CG_4_10_14_0_8_um_filter_44_12]PIZ84380.1 MAG: hypothetical protein COX96_04125 [Candidatus Omnitrophica bacterium CG_4_10_14_0_2_um_filter_44_9]